MAFTSSVSRGYLIGPKRKRSGPWANTLGSDSGGAISTGLSNIEEYGTTIDSHIEGSVPKTVVTAGSGTLTITTEGKVSGTWWAIGL